MGLLLRDSCSLGNRHTLPIDPRGICLHVQNYGVEVTGADSAPRPSVPGGWDGHQTWSFGSRIWDPGVCAEDSVSCSRGLITCSVWVPRRWGVRVWIKALTLGQMEALCVLSFQGHPGCSRLN